MGKQFSVSTLVSNWISVCKRILSRYDYSSTASLFLNSRSLVDPVSILQRSPPLFPHQCSLPALFSRILDIISWLNSSSSICSKAPWDLESGRIIDYCYEILLSLNDYIRPSCVSSWASESRKAICHELSKELFLNSPGRSLLSTYVRELSSLGPGVIDCSTQDWSQSVWLDRGKIESIFLNQPTALKGTKANMGCKPSTSSDLHTLLWSVNSTLVLFAKTQLCLTHAVHSSSVDLSGWQELLNFRISITVTVYYIASS